jgi:hypothetical protein
MGALILILPTLAFDVWIAVTVGKRQMRTWRQKRAWLPMAAVCFAAVVLAICCLAIIQYHWDAKTRVTGFPVPVTVFALEEKDWVRSTPPQPWLFLGTVTDIATGLVIPLIPFKIAEFIQVVKKEING